MPPPSLNDTTTPSLNVRKDTEMILHKANSLQGEVTIPGDKSISHRAIMLGSLAQGTTEVTNFLQGADCLSTIKCFQEMGVSIENNGTSVLIHGNGLHGLKAPTSTLDVGNSGTTMRLMSGILAGQSFNTTVDGDTSIRKRPMKRIITPLSQMGGKISDINGNGCAPLRIEGTRLTGIHYQSPTASAQIKSAVLLAGLYAEGSTSVTEPYLSRNHSELMFRYFGIPVQSEETTATITPVTNLTGQKVEVPGDISSAAYFMAAAAIVPNSEVCIKNVGTNPTRDGMIQVMKKMGANITLEQERIVSGEPVADIVVATSSLKGITIGGSIIPTLIDELPIIAVLAAMADGETIIKDAQELKVKESNRIDVMVHNLTLMGADIMATEDGMIIRGGKTLHGAVIPTKEDHRIAMSFAIASLVAEGDTEIEDAEVVNISYPDFYKDLRKLSR